MPTADAGQFIEELSEERTRTWRNEVTLRSLEMIGEYSPGAFIDRVSPTPLLLIVADGDALVPPDLTLAAFERALEPKHVVLLRGGHFEPYTGSGFEVASNAAREWFTKHLQFKH